MLTFRKSLIITPGLSEDDSNNEYYKEREMGPAQRRCTMAFLQRTHRETMKSQIRWTLLLVLLEALLIVSFSLPDIRQPPAKALVPAHSDNSVTMDASQGQNWMRNVRPTSESSNFFEDVPPSPPRDEDQSPITSKGFFHVPLEHELIASRSVWDDSANSDEVSDQHSITSPAAAASTPSEYSLTAVDHQARFSSVASRDPDEEERSPTPTVLNSRAHSSWTSDPLTSRIASAVSLDEPPVALEIISGPTIAVKVSFSAEPSENRNWDPITSESDIRDEVSKFSDYVNRSKRPAELTTIPSARVNSHLAFSRAERPGTSPTSSITEFFEIPIPIFPFPAGSTRCNNRKCPIKGRHEQGPYLHEGKLRSREGSMFGSSNPPPEIWFLYDMLKDENLQGTGRKAFAPVELFAKYHFGETRGEYVLGSDEAGGNVQQDAKQGGKKSRFLRFWG